MGVAEHFFPHPNEWRLGDIDKPLDQITVKDLTQCITEKISSKAKCLEVWESILGEMDWRTVLRSKTL